MVDDALTIGAGHRADRWVMLEAFRMPARQSDIVATTTQFLHNSALELWID